MRAIVLTLALLLVSASADAAVMRCRGFAFLYADMTCETTDVPSRNASFCDVMNRQGGAVRWSRQDTNETKDRADLINAAGKRLCGWGKVK
jgi:hypothetical protein